MASNIRSQEYKNIIIEFDGNPNPIQLIASDKGYIITSINFINGIGSSSLLEFEWQSNDIIRHNYEGFALTRNSFGKIKNSYYSYGDYNVGPEMVFFLKYDPFFNISSYNIYNTPSMNNGSTSSMFFQDCIYGASVDDFDGGAHREITLKKIDTLGNEVWSKNFNENIELSYAWEIDTTYYKNILISAGAHYYEKNGRFSHITKIDTSGKIIWVYQGTEAFDNGAVPLWIAPLSNQNIVMSYHITGLDAPDIRLQWIDKDGKYIKRKLIDVPDKDEMYHNQLETGKGDYFFAYGTYKFTDFTSYGIITKYDNDGNIIWEHLYQHELFNAPNDRCSIKDIIELDNGDIVALGDLSHAGGRNEIWLFKINEQGCFGTEACHEKVILTGIEESIYELDLQLYPNPTNGIIYISSEDSRIIGSTIKIVDLVGKQVASYQLSATSQHIDISKLQKGIYIYTIKDKSHSVFKLGKILLE